MVGAVREGRLDRLPNLAASEATGADPNALGRSIDHCTDTLEIGIKGALRLVVGMTDVMA